MSATDPQSFIELTNLATVEENESVSSLASEDTPEDTPEDSPDQEISTNSTQDTLSTQTQQEILSSDKSGRFQNLPQLKEVFDIIGWTKNRNRIVGCKFCSYKSSSNRLQRLTNHIKLRCKDIPESAKKDFLNSLDKTQATSSGSFQDQLNQLVVQVVIKNNVSFKIVDCPYFTRLIKFLNEKARVATREDISSKYVPKLAAKAEEQFHKKLSRGKNFQISIEFDHWKDYSKRLTLGVVATHLDGAKHLLYLRDVSLQGHYSYAIVDTLRMACNKIPPGCINAIISDAAAACKKAKSDIVNDPSFKHLIVQRCIAHFVNLIGTELWQDADIASTLNSANKLAGYASNSSSLAAKLVAAGKRKVSRATAVRWYSNVDMLESLVNARDILENHLNDEKDKQARCALRILDEGFWTKSRKIIDIARPLANCIAEAERYNGTLGEAVKSLLEFIKSLLELDCNDKYVVAALKAVFHYFNKEKLGSEIGLMIAAYFFDRRNKMDYVDTAGIELILETMGSLAVKTGFTADQFNTVLYPEFLRFYQQKAPFNRPVDPNQTALQWWNDIPNAGMLKEIALRLAALKSSSANIERVFSTIKLIQSPVRTNFNLETLEKVACAKLSLGQDDEDELLYAHLYQDYSGLLEDNSSQSASSHSSFDEEEIMIPNLDSNSLPSHSQSFSGSQALIATDSPRVSPEKRRRSLPTQVRPQERCETNFLQAGLSPMDTVAYEEKLRDYLGLVSYNRLKTFKSWFNFDLVNEFRDEDQDGTESPDKVEEEVEEMKLRFRTDLMR